MSTVIAALRLEHLELRDGSQYATVSIKGGGGIPAGGAQPTSISGDYSGEMILDVTRRRIVRLVVENRTQIDSPSGPRTVYGGMTAALIGP